MSLNMGQAAIAGTVAAFTIPPGACSITVYSAAATTLYLGTGKTLTATNGYAVTVYGLNTAATTLAVNYVISTES